MTFGTQRGNIYRVKSIYHVKCAHAQMYVGSVTIPGKSAAS